MWYGDFQIYRNIWTISQFPCLLIHIKKRNLLLTQLPSPVPSGRGVDGDPEGGDEELGEDQIQQH